MSRRKANEAGAPIEGGKKLLYPIHAGQQMRFMLTDAEEVLYGGAAGGGKSYALRAMLVSYCLQYPGATAVLFRRTFRELEDTHILRLQLELPSYIATYRASTHDFIFTNGSILMLRFCEKEEDVRTYDTFEADIMGFDELTAFSEFQYTYLTTRCRSTKPWWPGRRIRSATNPGNIGHVWVKKRWHVVEETEHNRIWVGAADEGGMTRQFIPAKIQDNPTLMRYSPHYMDQLRALPDEEYRAKALGDWNVFSGQFFSRWRHAVHVCQDFTIPADWRRYIFVDWGIAVPRAVYWAARPQGTNFIWLYREQYGAGIPTREQARLAAQATRAGDEKIEMIIVDPAMFAKERDADGNYMKSPADYWKEEFNGVTDVVRGNNERLQGASLFRECLDWTGIEGDQVQIIVPPRLKVFASCANFIKTVPALIHSKQNVEDVDTDGEDHAYDAVRYGLRYLFSSPDQKKQTRVIDTPQGLVVLDS